MVGTTIPFKREPTSPLGGARHHGTARYGHGLQKRTHLTVRWRAVAQQTSGKIGARGTETVQTLVRRLGISALQSVRPLDVHE